MTKTINTLLHAILPSQESWHVYLLSHWSTIMGNLSNRVRLEKIQGNTLVLGVYDQHWMQELSLLTPVLIERINEHLEKPYVADLRFKKAQRPPKAHRQQRVQKAKSLYQLNRQEEAALESIVDQELSQALKRFLERCHEE